jgi:hypothetical protein
MIFHWKNFSSANFTLNKRITGNAVMLLRLNFKRILLFLLTIVMIPKTAILFYMAFK